MTKDEWYVKLEGWAFDDARLHRLPLALLPVLAEHLANEEAAEQKMNTKDELTASEALFGFMGWLTARDEQVVFSANDSAAPAVGLVSEFCKVNGLIEPRKDWTTRLTMPHNSRHDQSARTEPDPLGMDIDDPSPDSP